MRCYCARATLGPDPARCDACGREISSTTLIEDRGAFYSSEQVRELMLQAADWADAALQDQEAMYLQSLARMRAELDQLEAEVRDLRRERSAC